MREKLDDWSRLQDPNKSKDFEEKVRAIFKELEGSKQDYQTRRILLGIKTKGFEKLEHLKSRRDFKRQMRRASHIPINNKRFLSNNKSIEIRDLDSFH